MAANDRTNIPPAPAYFPTSADSPLHPPTALYTSLRSLSPDNDLTKTQDFVVSPRSGKAWTVPAGALFRLSTPEGPQVGDLNVWNQHDPREKFWASRTRQLQGSHVVQGDRLWVELQSGVEGVMISWGRGVILMVCFLSIVVVAFPSAHSSVLFA